MGCGCENKKLSAEYDRIRKLAKALARIENAVVALYRRQDGAYSFAVKGMEQGEVIEYISEY